MSLLSYFEKIAHSVSGRMYLCGFVCFMFVAGANKVEGTMS